MCNGYFSSDTQVLLADGTYKNIEQVKVGDLVLNMRNEAVKVLRICDNSQGLQGLQGPVAPMCEIRYQNWYSPFYCTNNLQILTSVELIAQEKGPLMDEIKWISAQDLQKGMSLSSENNIYQSLLPSEFNIKISDTLTVQSVRNIGLLFGLYAGYGTMTPDGLEFRFGPNDALIEQVQHLLKDVFNADSTVEKNQYCYKIRSSGADLITVFASFGSKLERNIPRKYWVNNEEYLSGLFEGLIEYDPDNNISRYIPITKSMAEAFLWICSSLGLSFYNDTPRIDKLTMRIYPLFVSHEENDLHLGKILSVDTTANIPQSQWNLEVDCSTESFIANNLVVRALPRTLSEPEPTPTIEDFANEQAVV